MIRPLKLSRILLIQLIKFLHGDHLDFGIVGDELEELIEFFKTIELRAEISRSYELAISNIFSIFQNNIVFKSG